MAKSKYVHLDVDLLTESRTILALPSRSFPREQAPTNNRRVVRAPLSRAPTSGQRRYFTVCGIDLTVHMLHRYEKAKNVRLVDCPHCQETSYYMIAARRANLIVAAEHMFVGMALAQLGRLGMTERDVLFVQSSRLKIQGTWEDWATFARTYEPPVDTTIVGDGWWMVLQTHVGGVHWLYLTSPMRFVTHEDLDAEAKEVVAHDDEVQRVRRKNAAVAWRDATTVRKKWPLAVATNLVFIKTDATQPRAARRLKPQLLAARQRAAVHFER